MDKYTWGYNLNFEWLNSLRPLWYTLDEAYNAVKSASSNVAASKVIGDGQCDRHGPVPLDVL